MLKNLSNKINEISIDFYNLAFILYTFLFYLIKLFGNPFGLKKSKFMFNIENCLTTSFKGK